MFHQSSKPIERVDPKLNSKAKQRKAAGRVAGTVKLQLCGFDCSPCVSHGMLQNLGASPNSQSRNHALWARAKSLIVQGFPFVRV